MLEFPSRRSIYLQLIGYLVLCYDEGCFPSWGAAFLPPPTKEVFTGCNGFMQETQGASRYLALELNTK